MIGDYYRNFGYPYIDIANGGSLKGMLEALDFTMKVARPDTRLVPGHASKESDAGADAGRDPAAIGDMLSRALAGVRNGRAESNAVHRQIEGDG